MAQLLSNLSIGAKIKFGRHSINGEAAQEIIWKVVAKSHSGYPSNSITLWTEKIIDTRCFDAKEPKSSDSFIAVDGNSSYRLSNLAQWLNSDANAGEWYKAKHDADTPPTYPNARDDTDYTARPGFLNLFTDIEKASILTTAAPSAGSTVSQKVFLPSVKELGLEDDSMTVEGTYWGSYGIYRAQVTQQVFKYSNRKPATLSDNHPYWTRTAANSSTVIGIRDSGDITTAYSAANGYMGVKPVVNLPNTLFISDATDTEGCYTIDWNIAPDAPTFIAPPASMYGGKPNLISWGVASDPNGDAVTYQLECSIDGGGYTEIYNGTATAYAHLVPFGVTSVTYRIKATDPSGESSAYTASESKTVINNYSPVISGTDGNLGVKSEGFTGAYTVTDANSDIVTVTEAIDGVQIRSLVATLGQTITYGVTENTWLALPNGSHTLTIRATDGIDTTVRTYVFTKLVETLKIMNSAPWEASTMPSRIMLVVTRNIPSTSTFKVEVCNNGYDSSPTWEDATDAVKSGLVHVFTNAKKTASLWGVRVRVTVARNGATGACYISAIGGNFE